jgi:endogenous inhibitor of DNA gyrase (YacG/DUF329 family)
MVDLGSWAGESYRIPDENREDSQAPQSGEAEQPDNATAGRDKKMLH